MPKVILKIGCETILLPNEEGVATILKVLSRGAAAIDYTARGSVVVDDRALEVSMKLVSPGTRIVARDDRGRIPEGPGHARKVVMGLPGRLRGLPRGASKGGQS